jgi:hypothetical protein
MEAYQREGSRVARRWNRLIGRTHAIDVGADCRFPVLKNDGAKTELYCRPVTVLEVDVPRTARPPGTSVWLVRHSQHGGRAMDNNQRWREFLQQSRSSAASTAMKSVPDVQRQQQGVVATKR